MGDLSTSAGAGGYGGTANNLMLAAGPAMMGASAVLSASGVMMQQRGMEFAASQRKAQADFQAEQLEQNANAAMATSERQSAIEQRNTTYLASRALAIGAGSGAGGTDPGLLSVTSRIVGEGTYRSMAALYEGKSQERQMRLQAAATTYGGEAGVLAAKAAAPAAGIAAGATLLGGTGNIGSMYARYWAGPKSSGYYGAENMYMGPPQ